MKDRTIYMLPGRGGLLDKGLGAELQGRGYKASHYTQVPAALNSLA